MFIKNNKGITMISLVVTIVVLIILASITIGTLTGENGIIKRAENAKNETEVSGKLENDTLNSYLNIIDSTTNFNNIGGTGNNTTGGGDNTTGDTHTHNYSVFLTSTEATCVTAGSTTYKCSGCDSTQTTSTPINSSNHTGGTSTQYVYIDDNQHSVNTVCSSCNAVLSSITQNHTIDGSGTCSDCKHDITSGHTHSYANFVETVKEATCIEQAQNKYSCTVCGSTTIIAEGDLLEHTWNSGVVTTEPTTITEGVRTYTCTVTGCGATKTEAIEMLEKSENTLTLSDTSVTLNNSTTSKTITVTSLGDGVISASSSNTSVATVSVSGSNITIKSVNNTSGTATITINAAEGTTHKAASTTCDVTASFIIPISTVPSQSGSLTYSGSAQSPTWSNYDSSQMTIGGTTTGTNAGAYTATFTPKSGYSWSDGSTTSKSVTWRISAASMPSITYVRDRSLGGGFTIKSTLNIFTTDDISFSYQDPYDDWAWAPATFVEASKISYSKLVNGYYEMDLLISWKDKYSDPLFTMYNDGYSGVNLIIHIKDPNGNYNSVSISTYNSGNDIHVDFDDIY